MKPPIQTEESGEQSDFREIASEEPTRPTYIKKPLSADGLLGTDEFGQLWACRRERNVLVGTMVSDPQSDLCPLCGKGWELTAESHLDQLVLRDGKGNPYHVHESCDVKRQAGLDLETVVAAFVSSKIPIADIVPIKNRYWNGASDHRQHERPWYETRHKTQPVTIIVGRRKRVWSIELSPMDWCPSFTWLSAAENEFVADKVTKSFEPRLVVIHAWNNDELTDYLTRLGRVAEFL